MRRLRLPARRAGTPRTRFVVTWVVVAGALVALPIVATALRSSRFSAAVEVFPRPRPVFGQARDPVAYLRRLLRAPRVEISVRENVDPQILLTPLDEHVRIAPFKRHALVTVWADTPERASVLLDALVLQLANASADDLYALATADLPVTRARLALSSTRAERTVLLRRMQLLQQIIAKPPQALVAPPRPGPGRPLRLVDRIVNAVPGRFPPRPAMLDAVLVGLALAFPFSLLILWEQRKPARPGLDVRRFLWRFLQILWRFLQSRVRPLVRVPVVALVAYLLLTLTGTTTSYLGVDPYRADPTHPAGTMFGEPRGIRSDEWLRISSIKLGVLASGSTRFSTPLAQHSDLVTQVPSGGIVESIVFFDGAALRLGRFLPDRFLFAADWWFPTLLIVLCLPPWLRRLGAKRHMAWFATGLVLLAPASVWWSLGPIRLLGFTVAGSVLAMHAVDRFRDGRRGLGVGLALAAGVLLARMPTSYIPWSITLSVPVALATAAWVLSSARPRRGAILIGGIVGASALALFVGTLLENLAAFTAELHTVYPGLSRFAGRAVGAAQELGAPAFAYVQGGTPPVTSSPNPSELSSAYTFCAAWALVLWAGTSRLRSRRVSAPLAVLSGLTVFWLAWSMGSFSRIGSHVPIVNLVAPNRAAQTVGFLATMVLALLHSRLQRSDDVRIPIVAALVCGGLTAYGVWRFHQRVPAIGAPLIVGAAGAVTAVVFLVSRYPDRWQPVAVGLLAAAACVWYANPVLIGLGDLRSTPTAQRMLQAGERTRAAGEYWASDSIYTDGLLLAMGVPSLTGQQLTGPVRRQWRKLDPTDRYEAQWNRGASFVEMSWTGDRVPIITASLDQILVSIDPCKLPAYGFNVSHILSRSPLTASCLTSEAPILWGGYQVMVYRLRPS